MGNAVIEINQFEEITQVRLSHTFDGKPLFWVAAYLVDGLLIDTGCAYTAEEFMSFMEKHSPKLAVNTHFHEDHVGANHILQKRFGIPIYAPADSLPLIARKAELFPYQEFVWGYPEPTIVLPIPDTIRTERFTFEVVETPGHSVGHVSLVERTKGWCFTGDIYPGKAIRTLRPEEDMEGIVASLNKLSALPTDRLVLLTSIGRIIEKGREAINDFVGYISGLSRTASDLQTGGASIAEIVTALFDGENARAQLTNGQYTTENLVRSILRMRRT